MFTMTATWYHALYCFKDYTNEADDVAALIHKVNADARSVLDVACGSGEHGKHLCSRYDLDGIDINPEFLPIASGKNSEGIYTRADMADFRLERKYDIVMCLFSSIGYVKTIERMNRALPCFADHLTEGGAVIVEPWFTPNSWKPDGSVFMISGATDEGKVCRMSLSEVRGRMSLLNFRYLVGTTKGIEHLTEKHELGLFAEDEMMEGFRKAGLSLEYSGEGLSGRGLYVGTRAQ